jgi:predicted GIY-YIG superfamily endonuclease
MSFWAYMIQCGDRTFYVGHTNDLEKRWGEHQTGAFGGYTSTRHPLHLVWPEEFGTRAEAVEAEHRIKGWSRAKKLALIRGDWNLVSELARSKREGRASTSSAQTVFGGGTNLLFLHPHLAQLPSASFSLEASLRLIPDHLSCRFRLTGDLSLVRVPRRAPAVRRDNLWQHTCLEAFLETPSGYLEFNLSPSTEWAAYAFTGFREGMRALDMAAPVIRTKQGRHALELTAELPLPPDLHPTRLGLSAVIEEVSGHKSYWALRHPPGETPDFHHPDCFALELPSPRGA